MTDANETTTPVVSSAPTTLVYSSDDQPLTLGELAELAIKMVGIY